MAILGSDVVPTWLFWAVTSDADLAILGSDVRCRPGQCRSETIGMILLRVIVFLLLVWGHCLSGSIFRSHAMQDPRPDSVTVGCVTPVLESAVLGGRRPPCVEEATV